MPYNVEFQSSVFPEECRITKTKFDPRKWHFMTKKKKMGIVIYQISVSAESRGHVLVFQFSSSFEILVIW